MGARSKIHATIVAALGLSVLLMPAKASAAGLYGDESKEITTGDIKDHDYWSVKFDMMMLDLAIKQHQPEGKIGLNLASTSNDLKDLVKKYPKHKELKEWQTKVEDTIKKIDPDASRNVDWKPGCPWDEANFKQAWMNFYYGKMLIADKDISEAKGIWSNVVQNFAILTKPDRLKDYPDDLKKWIDDNKKEVEDTAKALKER